MNHEHHTNEQNLQEKERRIQYEIILAKKPKKPLNGYFKFRMQKIAELGDVENRSQKVKEAWQQLSAQAKEILNIEYQNQLKQFRQLSDQWKKQLEKYIPLVPLVPQVEKRKLKFYRTNNDTNQQQYQQQQCERCSILSKQNKHLYQQIKIMQENHAKALQILYAQQKQIKKYKQQHQQRQQSPK